MNDTVLRDYIRKVLKENLDSPKGEWILLDKGDVRRDAIRDQVFDMVQQTYSSIGGHFKLKEPSDLERYKYWVAADIDTDPDADVVLLGKPDIRGQKFGGAANDGTRAAASAYKAKSAELRSTGGNISGIGNWWGEVSGKPAYALLTRGAPAVESEEMVRQLLDGDDFIFHGEHPDPNANEVFKSAKGWYTKNFAGKASTKIIIGSPS